MSQSTAITSESPEPAASPTRKGRPLVAWLVILAAVGFILWRYWTVAPVDRESYDLLVMRLQGRYLVGLVQLENKLSASKSGGSGVYEEIRKTLNRGPYAQRLRFVVLAGELKGPDEAREQLRQIDAHYRHLHGDPPADDTEMAAILDRLYALRAEDPAATTALPEQDQRELRQRLGWFGDLALAPPDGADSAARMAVLTPAYRAAWSMLAGISVLLCLGVLGLTMLVALFVMWCLGLLRGGLATGSTHGGVYAETFALYMVLFLALGYGASWLRPAHGRLLLSGLAALGSLAALIWPVLRGIPWRQVRQDIGWQVGRRPWLEPVLGVGCYALALPLLLVGVLIMLGLTRLRDEMGWGPDEFGPSDAPGHPIIFWVAHGGWWVWLEVFFVASIVAPIVEETMFRGVLYRHLREGTSGFRPAVSVLFSAVVVSYLFAVIHPQGFLAVPALMALALAFTLMREWRGTLLPAMIAHGINNAVATLLLFLMMS